MPNDQSRVSFSTGSTDNGAAAPSAIVWEQPCSLKGFTSGLGAGVLGYVFGVLPSMLKNRSLKSRGIWHADGWTSFKAFAIMSGLYTAVHCFAVRIRQTDDKINRGIAGAISGLAIGWSGGALSALQSAAFVGGLSYFFDIGGETAPAKAAGCEDNGVSCSGSCCSYSRRSGAGAAALSGSPTSGRLAALSLHQGARSGRRLRLHMQMPQAGSSHLSVADRAPVMWLGTVFRAEAYFRAPAVSLCLTE